MQRVFIPVLCALLVAAAGCATTALPQPPPPLPPDLSQVPTIPRMPAPDLASLRGRRICIDPGHGGPWPGAVAPSNGLREADVNLRVSLALKQLIEQAGGEAIMTRIDDSVLVPENGSRDLVARADMANKAGADVFVSIHHNADISGSGRNDLEVFYKLGEDGPSLDLAQCLTFELAQRLRAEAVSKLLLPGNYSVLRNARVPAVLLESSYMTHAGNATFLADQKATDAEAFAIAAGLARYFRLEPPRIVSVRVIDAPDGRTQALLVEAASSAPLEPATARVVADGHGLPGHAEILGTAIVYTFNEPLPNGQNRLLFSVRNRLGAAGSYVVEAAIERAVESLTVFQWPADAVPGRGTVVLFEVHATDALGLPAADGTPVMLKETGESASTRGGVARFYGVADAGSASVTFQSGGATAKTSLSMGDVAFNSVNVTNATTRLPLGGAVVASSAGPLGATTPEGWVAFPASSRTVSVSGKGYETGNFTLRSGHTEISLKPLYGGALLDRRIVIDPAHGGRVAGAIGPRGTRAGDISLDVARRLAARLEAAGAVVELTRTGDQDPTELQRVQLAADVAAELFVSLSFGAPGSSNRNLDDQGRLKEGLNAFVGHYPESATGLRLAKIIAQRLGIATVTPSVAYVVQQTGCPAVLVQPDAITSHQTEDRYLDAGQRERVAQALCDALVTFFRQ